MEIDEAFFTTSEPLRPYATKVAEMLWFIDRLVEIFPHWSVSSIQKAAGVPNNFIPRLRDGEGATYENMQKLDAFLAERRAEFAQFAASISVMPKSAQGATAQ